ncbi:ricin-type beta-trefoil lectin domain protein [Streptomyces sp. NBC_01471]|uniref:ricin-type beta-trefoil lectin domain protein n=1 Tax=Streptomyces sp. NBC_01471 TaxID=2903879 RepID=UPI003248F351
MKVALVPPRRAWRVAAVALLLSAPTLWSAPQSASADSRSYPLLYDAGPANNCYSMLVEYPPDGNTAPAPQGQDLSGCTADSKDYTFNTDTPHAAWDQGIWGWNTSSWGSTPGYSFQQTPTGSGSPKTVTMANHATGDCGLHETNVSYTYSGTQLRPGPDNEPLTMDKGAVNVSYDANVQQSGGFQCPEHRAIVTTDFILEDPWNTSASPDVISVVHFDPGTFQPVKDDGVQWSTMNPATKTCEGGCRVMVHSSLQMPDSSTSTTRISDDFSSLFQQYQAYINPSGLPASDFKLRGVQVVSSNVGTDTTTSLSNVDAHLVPGPALHGPLTYGLQGSGGSAMCLDDYNNAQQSPATVDIWDCNGGDSQDWTLGWDGTVQVHGLCLDAAGAGTANGTPVGLYTCNGGQNQQWVLGRNDQLYNPDSGRCLEINGTATANGSKPELYDCWGGQNEKWRTTA